MLLHAWIFKEQKRKPCGDVQCRQMCGSENTLTLLGYIDHLGSDKDHYNTQLDLWSLQDKRMEEYLLSLEVNSDTLSVFGWNL